MNQKQFLIRGTFLLTAAGVFTRLLGFFYKIFLARVIGAEEIGIFHLILPVNLFFTAAVSGGIQTAISRYSSEYSVRQERKNAGRILAAGLLLSVPPAVAASFLIWHYSGAIALYFLAEPRCAVLLRITSFSLPFSVIHACFCGYFIGVKQVKLPAAAQLLEQTARIGAVLVLYLARQKNNLPLTVSSMALGQVSGELASSLFCTVCFLGQAAGRSAGPAAPLPAACRKLLSVSVPLGVNRMLICVLQGIEAALLPQQLVLAGLTSAESLALYGTLSGMTLPLLLFPTAVTGALGVLLLPAVSEARVMQRSRQLAKTIEGSFLISILLGLFCFGVFVLSGPEIGCVLFNSRMAGQFTASLAWLCPFMYLNATLTSILHGLGKTGAVSLQSTLGFLVRLASVLLLVPSMGIQGYFAGLFFSQLLVSAFVLSTLRQSAPLRLPPGRLFLRPLAACTASICFSCLLRAIFPYLEEESWGGLILGGSIFSLSFPVFVFILTKKRVRS